MYVPAKASTEIAQENTATEVLPAIVVRTWGETIESTLNLQVFLDGVGTSWKTSVAYSKEKLPNTWHWPEIKR